PCLVAVPQAAIKIDDPADELRRENADAAVVEEIDAARLARLFERGVVAKMRIAVDDAEAGERQPPRLEHCGREPVANFGRSVLVSEQFLPLQPIEYEQSSGRKRGPDIRYAHLGNVGENFAIERDVFRLAAIIQLLAHTLADFLGDLARID